ncbi:hypothetical protein MBLNU457_7422t1 [Dothideomycetes sp. NU457]
MLILSQEPIPFSFGDLWRFTLVVGLTAPPNYLWQVLLERTFPGRPAPKDYEEIREVIVVEGGGVSGEGTVIQERRPLSWKNTFLKWFIDCITLGALWNCILFLTLMNLVKHKSLEGTTDAIRTETIPIITASYRMWPIASVVNFTLIPVERRLLFLSLVGWLWGIYMSFVAARQ